jgi:hypothetical protein
MEIKVFVPIFFKLHNIGDHFFAIDTSVQFLIPSKTCPSLFHGTVADEQSYEYNLIYHQLEYKHRKKGCTKKIKNARPPGVKKISKYFCSLFLKTKE